MKRTDVHAPSRIKPEDYEFVVINSREEDFNGGAIFQAHMKATGGRFSQHKHGGNCDVCGAYMIDYAIFWHQPTNTYIKTGCDCAAHIEAGHEDAFRRQAQLRRKAAERKAQQEAIMGRLEELGILDFVETMFHEGRIGQEIVGYNLAHPDAPSAEELEEKPWAYDEWYDTIDRDEYDRWHMGTYLGHEVAQEAPMYLLRRADADFFTLADMVRNLVRFGSWSDKQAAYAVKLTNNLRNLKETVIKWQEEQEALADVPEGRIVVTGTVLSTKFQEGYYGTEHKMLVQDDTGFKVWGTVPSKISSVQKGDRIQYTVTVKPSPNDAKFGFGSRPSKATILEKADDSE